jgi:hypothetical protein
MKKNKLYRNQYLIGIYGPVYEGEPLLGLCDNVKEFAQFMDIKESNARMILHKLFHKQTNFIRFFGKICSIEFISIDL